MKKCTQNCIEYKMTDQQKKKLGLQGTCYIHMPYKQEIDNPHIIDGDLERVKEITMETALAL